MAYTVTPEVNLDGFVCVYANGLCQEEIYLAALLASSDTTVTVSSFIYAYPTSFPPITFTMDPNVLKMGKQYEVVTPFRTSTISASLATSTSSPTTFSSSASSTCISPSIVNPTPSETPSNSPSQTSHVGLGIGIGLEVSLGLALVSAAIFARRYC